MAAILGKKRNHRGNSIILAMLLSSSAQAAPPSWKIVPEKSRLTFTAVQNGAPISGNFSSFSGAINFDPKSLAESHVRITIDLTSITTPYAEVADMLRTSDWFDTSRFPQAIFQADSFEKKESNLYEGRGNLTIRDKTVPATLTFSLDDYSPTHAHVTGKTLLKRTSFGIGQGQWANTDAVKDDVTVDFVLEAVSQ
jgi:polyisoprenoid-binding protein YceI